MGSLGRFGAHDSQGARRYAPGSKCECVFVYSELNDICTQ